MLKSARALGLTSCAILGPLADPALAQKTGGVLKFFHRDSPASMSTHEEATISTVGPMMACSTISCFSTSAKSRTGRNSSSPSCGSERNYTNYCNPELEKMYEQQPIEPDRDKRQKLVSEIDRRLQKDAGRPMIYQQHQAAETGIVPSRARPWRTRSAGGYGDSQSRFIVRNSWGTDWGLQGYFLMPTHI